MMQRCLKWGGAAWEWAAMHNYALIDNASGYLWWIGEAASPELACAAATMHTGGYEAQYGVVGRLDPNADGYFVYEAPADFKLGEVGRLPLIGVSQPLIDAVGDLPLVGRYQRVRT